MPTIEATEDDEEGPDKKVTSSENLDLLNKVLSNNSSQSENPDVLKSSMFKLSRENDGADNRDDVKDARNSQEIIKQLLSDIVGYIDSETSLSETTSELAEPTTDDDVQKSKHTSSEAMDETESGNDELSDFDTTEPLSNDFTSLASESIQPNTDSPENESDKEHVGDGLKSENTETLDGCSETIAEECAGVKSIAMETESVQSDSTSLDIGVDENSMCMEESEESTISMNDKGLGNNSLTEAQKHLKYLISEKRQKASKESVNTESALEENTVNENCENEAESREMGMQIQGKDIKLSDDLADNTGIDISNIKTSSYETNVEARKESHDQSPHTFDTIDSGTKSLDSEMTLDSAKIVQDCNIDKAVAVDTGETMTKLVTSTAIELIPVDKSEMTLTDKESAETAVPLVAKNEIQSSVGGANAIADDKKQVSESFSRESTLSPESAMALETVETTEMSTETDPIPGERSTCVLDNAVRNRSDGIAQEGNTFQTAPSIPIQIRTSITAQTRHTTTPEKIIPDQDSDQTEQIQSSINIVPAESISKPNVPLEKTPVKQSLIENQALRQSPQIDKSSSGIAQTSSVEITKPNVAREKTPVKQTQPSEKSAGKLTKPNVPLEKTPVKQTQPSENSAGKLTKPNVPLEKTPVKQTHPSRPLQRQSPQAATKKTPSKVSLKPTQASGKQSFIDNLIATGVPIVIPDDDDDEKDSMPKARSNIFKMKSQQYKQQSNVQSSGATSRSFGKRDAPSVYDPHTGVYKSQNRPAASPQRDRIAISPQRAALQTQSDTYLQQQSSMFSPQKESLQAGTFAHPSFSSPSRRSFQAVDMVSSPQGHRSADQYMPQTHQPVSSQYRAAPEHEVYSPTHQLGGPPPYRSPPPYTSLRTVTPNKRVSFSPVVHVAHSSPSTPPRYPSPQGQKTQAPPNISVSPRMASPRGTQQISHVRRNITYPQQQSIARTAGKGKNEAPTIVIDDDTPTPKAPGRPTAAKKPDDVLPSLASLLQEPSQTQMLPVIASVTSMAKMSEQSFPPESPPIAPKGMTLPVTVSPQQYIPPASPHSGATQKANEKTPVKRSRSDDTMVSGESPLEAHAKKRRNTLGSVAPQVAYASSSAEKPGPSVADFKSIEQGPTEPTTEAVSPSKNPPEVIIDIDVDDKTHFKRRLNIEQGHITKASPLSSPESESMHMVSSRNENVTSPDSTAPSSTTKPSGPRRPGRPRTSSGPSFACGDCEKTFASKAALKTHFKKHTKEKPFECDVCGKHFSQKSRLKKHIYTHFKDKDD